jgi:hypothetical protein
MINGNFVEIVGITKSCKSSKDAKAKERSNYLNLIAKSTF